MPAARNSWPWSRHCGTAGPTTRSSMNRSGGRYARPDRIRPINHRGDFYQVAGPLNLPRWPSGPAGSGASGIIRHRAPLRRPQCGRPLFTAHVEKVTVAGLLRRSEGVGDGRGAAARPGADPAWPQPDDRVHGSRGAPPGEGLERACGPRVGGASGCPAGSAGHDFCTCRSIDRFRPRISPTPARSRRRTAGPK